MLTPLKLNTFTGELAHWDNFACVVPDIQSFVIRPVELERIESRFKGDECRPIILKITNIETGIEFNSAQELADKLGCKRSSVYTKICSGEALGYVNVATKEFMNLGSRRASIAAKLKMMESGFQPAHFIKGTNK